MKFDGIDKVLGLELNSLGDQQYSCRYCIVSKKSNNLIIEKKGILVGALNTILTDLPKNMPTSVVLSGKGVIHKNQQASAESLTAQLFSTAFPSIEQNQFYAQVFRNGEVALVSIARKQEVDEVLNRLDGAGIKVYMASFGAMVTTLIWQQLNFYGGEIQFDGHLFNVSKDKQFVSYRFDPTEKDEFPIKVDIEPIPEENIVCYAAAFQLHLHNQIEPIIADVTPVNERLADFLVIAGLKNNAAIFLFAFFGALLLSFLIFSHYNQQNVELLKQVGSKLASIDQIDLLKNNISENEALLKKMNWANGYNHGYLINELGQSMPRQLTLGNIVLNQFRTEEEKTMRNPVISINGTTGNLSAVNNWIFLLKEKKWVKAVKLIKYQEDEQTEMYQFSLLINY